MRPFLHALWPGVWIAGPIVLAVVLWRLAAGRDALRGAADAARAGGARLAAGAVGLGSTKLWRPVRASSGNAAFDEWRDVELARLAEQRRHIEATRRRFGEFMDRLRRAKDREEFDRFRDEAVRPGQAQDASPVPFAPGREGAPPAS